METREIKLWQRAVAMLCAIAMLAMLFPTGILQTFAATGELVASAKMTSLYADATNGTNSTTVTASGLTAGADEEISYEWIADDGGSIVTLEDAGTQEVTVTAISGQSGAVKLTVNVSSNQELVGMQVADVTVSVYAQLADFEVSVAPESTTVGTQLVATPVVGTATGSVAYQWYESTNSENSVATGSTYTPAAAGSYYVVATYPADGYILETQATSNTVTVALNDVIVSVDDIANGSYIYGDVVTVELSADVAGTFAVTAGTTDAGAAALVAAQDGESYKTTVTLDTTSVGSKAFTYAFTPANGDAYNVVASTTINYSVAQKALEFTVTAANKAFDNTDAVASIDVVASADNALVDGDTGDIVLVTSSGVEVAATDFVLNGVGDVSVDTNVTAQANGVTFAVKVGNDIDPNYSATVTYGQSTITANTFAAADVATVATGDYVDGNINWYDDVALVTALSGYEVADTLDGTYGENVGVAPADDIVTFYVKATATGAIAQVTADGVTYKVDSDGPDVSYTAAADGIDFSNESVSYQVTVSDAGSGVVADSVYYYISTTEGAAPEATDSDWVQASAVESGEGYTFTVTTPMSGYVYVKAEDNVGNDEVSDEIRTLVLEQNAPSITMTSTTTGNGPQQTTTYDVTTYDATVDGAAPYDYSGIYKLEYYYTVTTTNRQGTSTTTSNTVVLVENTTPTDMSGILALRTATGSISIGNVTGTVVVYVTATDFCGNTYTISSDEVSVDATVPTVTLEMSGVANVDGLYYYNASNGDVSVVFTDDYLTSGGTYSVALTSSGTADTANGEVDTLEYSYAPTGTSTTTNGSITLSTDEDGKGVATITFSAEEVATLADGTISITVSATDNAGNAASEITSDTGVSVSNMVATFVLDTAAPIITAIETSPDANGVSGTSYYYNTDVTTTVTISDANVGDNWKATVSLDSETTEFSVNDGSVSFTLTAEGTYTDYMISGSDKAGNTPVFDTDVTTLNADEVDEATIANGVVTLANTKVIDKTAPTASITYVSSATPNLYAENGETTDTAYYNANVSAKVEFDDITEVDYGTLYTAQDDAGTEITASTETIAVSADDSYTFGAYGTDLAGNALIVTEYTPGDDAVVAAQAVTSKESYDAVYAIVVDTVAPTYTFVIETDATNEDVNSIGDRYYFNEDYTVTVKVSDENLDDALIVVERASDTLSTGDDSSVAALDFTGATALATTDGEVTDAISADGLYRYQMYGTDKAGNALVAYGYTPNSDQTVSYEDATNKDTTADLSHYIVVDTVAPTGMLYITNDTSADYDAASFYYEITTDGTVSVSDPYRSEEEAKVFMIVDDSETSPVQIGYTISSLYTDKTAYEYVYSTDATFAYGKLTSALVSGQQIFTVEDYLITDLAGNTSASGFVSNKIYLDVAAPTYDELQPTISVDASANSSANGPSGQPLFNTSVPVQITISDPYATSTSSGLGDITWQIFVNGVEADSGVLNTKVTTDDFADADSLTYTIDETITFSSASYNYNDLELVVTAYDNAGNETVKSYAFGIDVTKPTISITYDNNDADNDKYFSEIRTATVVVTERNFDSSAITITTEGSVGTWSYSAGSSANGDDDTWTTQILYAVDGEYTLEISGQDLVGNNADSITYTGVATNDFVIDTTVPVVTVTYNTSDASNGMYYNVDRIATITVDDVNFVGTNDIVVTATAGGVAPSVAFAGNATTLSFTADGNYVFGGTVTDLAGNVSAVINEAEFVIDQTLPEISISGVEDLSANNDPLDIVLSMTDTNLNLSSITATLTGTNNGEVDISGNAAYISGGVEYVLDTIETDDYYLLVFVGTDLAGNSVSQSVSFSENQNGTVFEFVQEEVRNTYSNQSFAPSFILHNVDEVTVLSLTLNGEEVAYDYVDNTVTFREALTADGMYKITMDTVDAAGNENAMETVEFYLDFTAPVLSVDGAEDGEYYFEAFTVTLRQDNSADTYLLLQLNGKDLDEGDYTVNADGSISISIDTFQEYQLTAQLIDAAGNTSEVVDISFELTNNIFIRWYANKVLFFGSLAAATVLLAALILIVLKKRSKEEEPANV